MSALPKRIVKETERLMAEPCVNPPLELLGLIAILLSSVANQ